MWLNRILIFLFLMSILFVLFRFVMGRETRQKIHENVRLLAKIGLIVMVLLAVLRFLQIEF